MNAEPQPASKNIEVVAIPGWAELPWLVHGFSTRTGGQTTAYAADGELNLGFTTQDIPQTVAANRQLFLSRLTGKAPTARPGTNALLTLRQTHTAIVHRVDSGTPAGLEGDGLMTDEPGQLLGILTADCVPVLVVDTRLRTVAAFHAGWRGTVQRIVEAGIARMRTEFNSRPEDLLAAVGPAIGPCCYTVGEDLRHQFTEHFTYATELLSPAGQLPENSTGFQLDLAEANRRQLLAAGLSQAAISMTGLCTSCNLDRFFSHRAEHGVTGRMMAVIGVRDSYLTKESHSAP